MSVDRKKILESLQAVRPGLANQEVIEQSNCFIFVDGMVYTYNDEIAVSNPVDLDINGAVSAKELFELLSKIKDDKVDIEIDKGELIIAGAGTAGIRLQEDVTLPFLELPEDLDWGEVPVDFSEALQVCIFSAAPESVSAILNSIHVSKGYAESCDNFRITRYYLDSDLELLIPASSARIISGYTFSFCSKYDGWIHFESEEGLRFSCRTYEEDYPHLDEYLDVDGDEVELPKGLSGMLDCSGIFSQTDDSNLVEIDIQKGKCIVRSENEKGWYESPPAKIEATEVDFVFSMNPSILKDILKLTSSATLGDNAIKFITENFEHAVTLSVK